MGLHHLCVCQVVSLTKELEELRTATMSGAGQVDLLRRELDETKVHTTRHTYTHNHMPAAQRSLTQPATTWCWVDIIQLRSCSS